MTDHFKGFKHMEFSCCPPKKIEDFQPDPKSSSIQAVTLKVQFDDFRPPKCSESS